MFEEAIRNMVDQSQRDNDRADGWLSSIAEASQAGDVHGINQTIHEATAMDAKDSREASEDGAANIGDRE